MPDLLAHPDDSVYLPVSAADATTGYAAHPDAAPEHHSSHGTPDPLRQPRRWSEGLTYYSQVPHDYYDLGLTILLGPSAWTVFGLMLRHADACGHWRFGLELMAARIGMSEPTIRRALKLLSELQIARIIRDKNMVEYSLAEPRYVLEELRSGVIQRRFDLLCELKPVGALPKKARENLITCGRPLLGLQAELDSLETHDQGTRAEVLQQKLDAVAGTQPNRYFPISDRGTQRRRQGPAAQTPVTQTPVTQAPVTVSPATAAAVTVAAPLVMAAPAPAQVTTPVHRTQAESRPQRPMQTAAVSATMKTGPQEDFSVSWLRLKALGVDVSWKRWATFVNLDSQAAAIHAESWLSWLQLNLGPVLEQEVLQIMENGRPNWGFPVAALKKRMQAHVAAREYSSRAQATTSAGLETGTEVTLTDGRTATVTMVSAAYVAVRTTAADETIYFRYGEELERNVRLSPAPGAAQPGSPQLIGSQPGSAQPGVTPAEKIA